LLLVKPFSAILKPSIFFKQLYIKDKNNLQRFIDPDQLPLLLIGLLFESLTLFNANYTKEKLMQNDSIFDMLGKPVLILVVLTAALIVLANMIA